MIPFSDNADRPDASPQLPQTSNSQSEEPAGGLEPSIRGMSLPPGWRWLGDAWYAIVGLRGTGEYPVRRAFLSLRRKDEGRWIIGIRTRTNKTGWGRIAYADVSLRRRIGQRLCRFIARTADMLLRLPDSGEVEVFPGMFTKNGVFSRLHDHAADDGLLRWLLVYARPETGRHPRLCSAIVEAKVPFIGGTTDRFIGMACISLWRMRVSAGFSGR